MKNQFFIVFQHIVPQHWLSRIVGKLAASTNTIIKSTFINVFYKKYKIDLTIAQEENVNAYRSFNEFFTRPLKSGVRPICAEQTAIACPADGAISQLGTIEKDRIFQAKGQHYTVSQLLGDKALAQHFEQGAFATVYLSPKDYHRVHMPFDGVLTETRYIPGKLFSVNTTTAQHVDALFARNERLVCVFDTDLGKMCVVLVGAMIVAGIETVATGKIKPSTEVINQSHHMALKKGDELGRFYLGSTAIVLFEPNCVTWHASLSEASPVVMGQSMASVIKR